jgi:protein xylosyltransferase
MLSCKRTNKSGLIAYTTFLRRLIQSQSFNWHFVECDQRMWRVGLRKLPIGLQVEGAIDWFFLHHRFIYYLIYSREDYLIFLKRYFNHTVYSPEVTRKTCPYFEQT